MTNGQKEEKKCMTRTLIEVIQGTFKLKILQQKYRIKFLRNHFLKNFSPGTGFLIHMHSVACEYC